MAFRLLRICSREDVFEQRLEDLKVNFLIPLRYHPKIIDAKFRKVRNLPGVDFDARRKQSLVKKPSKYRQTNRVTAPFDYSLFLPKISGVLNKPYNAILFIF